MKREKIMHLGLTNGNNRVEYCGIAYKPYQERWRERPDETRQPVNSRCQIRRQTKDEDSIDTHIESVGVCFFMSGERWIRCDGWLMNDRY